MTTLPGLCFLPQVFVETLDKCFENVCELDLIFHMDKVGGGLGAAPEPQFPGLGLGLARGAWGWQGALWEGLRPLWETLCSLKATHMVTSQRECWAAPSLGGAVPSPGAAPGPGGHGQVTDLWASDRCVLQSQPGAAGQTLAWGWGVLTPPGG